jgi:hypothetical protein
MYRCLGCVRDPRTVFPMRWKRGVQTGPMSLWTAPISKHYSQHHYGCLAIILDGASDLEIAKLNQITRCSHHTVRSESLRMLRGYRTAYRLCVQHRQRRPDLGASHSIHNKYVSSPARCLFVVVDLG